MIPFILMRNSITTSSISHGAENLIAGTTTLGYYGELPDSQFITGSALATLVGLTAGIPVSTSEPWLKFARNGKTLFISKRSLRHTLSWNQLNAISLVAGKQVIIDGIKYIVRLVLGGNADPATGGGGEWNDLMYKVSAAVGPWASFTDVQLGVDWAPVGTYTICKERNSTGSCINRGGGSIGHQSFDVTSTANAYYGWRPVLELVS